MPTLPILRVSKKLRQNQFSIYLSFTWYAVRVNRLNGPLVFLSLKKLFIKIILILSHRDIN